MSADQPTARGARSSLLADLDVIEVTIDKLVEGGDGFARYEGVPVFVARTAPGDRVRVRLVDRKPDYGRAEVEELLEPGPTRRPPPCRYFDRCGGCDLQQIDDHAQLELKVAAAVETLRRLGGIEASKLGRDSLETVAGESWGYRMRAQVQTQGQGENLELGFFERGSQRLVDVESCPVLHPDLEASLLRIRSALAELRDPPKRVDFASAGGRLSCAPPVAGLPGGALERKVGDFGYSFDARCFFQGNHDLLEKMVEVVIGAEVCERALDLYCGVGLFSLPLARQAGSVVAVEGDRIAARYARLNARKSSAANLEVVNLSVESAIKELELAEFDRIIVNPPRAGLSRPLRSALGSTPVAHLTYVSCRPATLARDLRALAKTYIVDKVTFFDLFPQTGQLEAAVALRARKQEGVGEM